MLHRGFPTLPLINQSRKKTSQQQAHERAEHPNPCPKYRSFLIHLFFLTFVNQTLAWTKPGVRTHLDTDLGSVL